MALRHKSVLGFLVLVVATGTVQLVSLAPGNAETATVTGKVDTGGGSLNRRAGASTSTAVLGKLPDGSPLAIVCQVSGESIRGQVRDTNLWNRLPDGQYVTDAYVDHEKPVPNCQSQSPADPPRQPTPAPSPTPVPTPAPTPSDTAPPGGTGPVAGTVSTGGGPLNVRAGTSTSAKIVDRLPNGTPVTVLCQLGGQQINGWARPTDQWNKLSDGRYVSDGYIDRAAQPPGCQAPLPAPIDKPPTTPSPITPGASWVVPVPGTAGQGFRKPSNPFHDGVDIMEPRWTPIRAASAGVVITVECNTSGPSCDVDGSPKVGGCGWYVEIRHAGNVITRYCHMVRKPEVSEGQEVVTGQVIGYVGTSGNSSGTHLHFEVHVGPGDATRDNAVDPVPYLRSVGAPLAGT